MMVKKKQNWFINKLIRSDRLTDKLIEKAPKTYLLFWSSIIFMVAAMISVIAII